MIQPATDLRDAFLLACLKAILRANGWSLRTAAAELGVHWTHLHKVLTGQRISASLVKRVHQLARHPR